MSLAPVVKKTKQINGPVTSRANVSPGSTVGNYFEYTDTGSNRNPGIKYADVQRKTSSFRPAGGQRFNFAGLGGIGGFQASDAYKSAMAYTNSLLEQLSGGRTAYSDKIDALMGKIENREKFSYDFNTDPLFQNALASAMSAGQTAMQDTIGQASALTGGYGSSYATSAANQAYNNYVKGAYDSLPEYYNIALNAYNMEGQELYNQLGMYRDADNSAYDRLANAYSANLSNAQMLYNQEYQNYWDTANYNKSVAQHNQDMAYKYSALAADREQANQKLKQESYASYMKNFGSGNTSGAKATFTASQLMGYKDKALKAFNDKGEKGLEAFMNSLPENISAEDAEAIYSHARDNTQVNDWSVAKGGKITTADKAIAQYMAQGMTYEQALNAVKYGRKLR